MSVPCFTDLKARRAAAIEPLQPFQLLRRGAPDSEAQPRDFTTCQSWDDILRVDWVQHLAQLPDFSHWGYARPPGQSLEGAAQYAEQGCKPQGLLMLYETTGKYWVVGFLNFVSWNNAWYFPERPV